MSLDSKRPDSPTGTPEDQSEHPEPQVEPGGPGLKQAADELKEAQKAIPVWGKMEDGKTSTERPRLWQDKRARPIVEFLWPGDVVDSGMRLPFDDGGFHSSDWQSEDVTPFVTSLSWADSISPPYQTITIQSRPIAGMQSGIPEYLYCRVRVPNSSPVDPGRMLTCGYMSQFSQRTTASANGALEQVETWSFIGWYDLCERAQLFGDFGLRTGSSRGTLLPWMEYDALLTLAESASLDTKMLGPALEALFTGEYGGKSAEMQATTTDKEGVTTTGPYAVQGLARIAWPRDAFITSGKPGAGFEALCDTVMVLHDDTSKRGTAGRKHAGLNTPFVPGLTGGHIYKSMQAGGSLASLLTGTFVCDRSMVELFPTTLYYPRDGGGKNAPALIYRMKPFRLTNGGAWIQLSAKTAAYAKRAAAISKKGGVVYVDSLQQGHGFAHGGIADWSVASNASKYLKGLLERIRHSYTRATDAAFGGDSWPLARSMAVDCPRDLVFDFTVTYNDSEQINVVCGGLYNTPDHYNMFGNFAGVPIMGREKAWIQGARVFRPTWPHQIADSRRHKNAWERDLLNDTLTVRAIAVEAAQTVLDQGYLASGNVTCVWNPDIRPGRVVRFRGLVGEYTRSAASVITQVGEEAVDMGSTFITTGTINFAYVEDVTHTYSANASTGALELRTSFRYTHLAAEETSRMNLMHIKPPIGASGASRNI